MATKTRGKGEGGLYKDSEGYWTAVIELPSHDGVRRRKKFRSKIKKVALEKLHTAKEELRARGDLPTTDQTVEQWMRYWFEEIASKEIRPKTAGTWRGFTYNHVIPTIGNVRLSQLAPVHIRRVTDRITDHLGLSGDTALTAHRVMSVAFEVAMQEKRIPRNPAKMMKAPRKDVPTLEVLDRDEGLTVLRHVMRTDADGKMVDPYGARWATALLTGARRGEVLGLTVDRVTDVLDLSWQVQRLMWKHGCSGSCNRKRGADCPARQVDVNQRDYEYRQIKGGLYFTRPKSKAGWRIIPLVDPLKSILEAHIAANPPGLEGLIFTRNGDPVDPDKDTSLWRRTLQESGIGKEVKLHGLRHTAVDMLYLAGVPEDLIVQIVGHSSRAMTRAYASRGNIVRLTEAMQQMSSLFNQPDPERSGRSAISA